jgi:hypothetical protein
VLISKTKLRSVTPEEFDLQFTLLPPSEVSLTEELTDTLRTGDAGTDLRIDWVDACSLGHDGEKYFLVIMDKGTEHVVTFNTKTRSDPVDVLAEYITITKRVPKFLRVDGAKEFVGAKMKDFCHLHNVTCKLLPAILTPCKHVSRGRNRYHQAAFSYCSLHIQCPNPFWPYATTDFVYKRNFLWC